MEKDRYSILAIVAVLLGILCIPFWRRIAFLPPAALLLSLGARAQIGNSHLQGMGMARLGMLLGLGFTAAQLYMRFSI